MVGQGELNYDIVEEWTYSDAIENGLKIDVKQAYEAVGFLMYALHNNPKAYAPVYGDVRVIKAEARPLDGLPEFRIFFRISQHHNTVFLLFIDHG